MAAACTRSWQPALPRYRCAAPARLLVGSTPGRVLKTPRVNNQRSHLDEELVRLQYSVAESAATAAAREAQTRETAFGAQYSHRHLDHHTHTQHHVSLHDVHSMPHGLLHTAAFYTSERLANAVALNLSQTGAVSVHVRDSDEQADRFLLGLALAAGYMDTHYKVTVCFEPFLSSTARAVPTHRNAASTDTHQISAGHAHYHMRHHHSELAEEYIVLVQLAQRSESADELLVKYEPINAGLHSNTDQLATDVFTGLMSQGASLVRCMWGIGGRTGKVPHVLAALCRVAQRVHTRVGMAVKVVPRLVHEKDRHGAVVYLSLFNCPLQ